MPITSVDMPAAAPVQSDRQVVLRLAQRLNAAECLTSGDGYEQLFTVTAHSRQFVIRITPRQEVVFTHNNAAYFLQVEVCGIKPNSIAWYGAGMLHSCSAANIASAALRLGDDDFVTNPEFVLERINPQ